MTAWARASACAATCGPIARTVCVPHPPTLPQGYGFCIRNFVRQGRAQAFQAYTNAAQETCTRTAKDSVSWAFGAMSDFGCSSTLRIGTGCARVGSSPAPWSGSKMDDPAPPTSRYNFLFVY